MKRLISIFFITIICFSSAILGCSENGNTANNGKLKIITTVFPLYDFARSIGGECVSVTTLIPAGGDSHSFEPTPKDIINIKNCDLFIYIGGESDSYIEDILSSLDKKPQTLVMTDYIDLSPLKSNDHDHGDSDHDYKSTQLDEHIWTSPNNCRIICNAIRNTLSEIDPNSKEYYHTNAAIYDNKLEKLDMDISQLVETIQSKVLIFGDRFPFLYFAERYGFEYFSAFPGCGGHSEPSAATVSNLIEIAESYGVSAIFYTETSNGNAAKAIAEHTGAKAVMLHSCHNITSDEYKNGVTYFSLMENNLKTLKEAFSVAAD